VARVAATCEHGTGGCGEGREDMVLSVQGGTWEEGWVGKQVSRFHKESLPPPPGLYACHGSIAECESVSLLLQNVLSCLVWSDECRVCVPSSGHSG